jgi:hypothetical protein
VDVSFDWKPVECAEERGNMRELGKVSLCFIEMDSINWREDRERGEQRRRVNWKIQYQTSAFSALRALLYRKVYLWSQVASKSIHKEG